MGISLYGLTPATTYDALIKTGDNEPLTASLKVLSDGVGTNLPMEASTTGINFTGALQQSGVAVPTASQVAAKQDTLVSGTNIKTINGTSVLGSGNIVTPTTSPSGVAGAIQFSNGSAFASDAANLFWDDTNNRLGVGTNAPTTALDLNGTLTSLLTLRNGATNFISIQTIGGEPSIRIWNAANTAMLNLFGTGTYLNQNKHSFCISDLATERLLIGATTAATIKGSGSTSATTSLLVQNSAGNAALQILDDGQIAMGFIKPIGTLMYLTGSSALRSDGRLGIGTTSMDASAQLQADSTTRGFACPRMTTTQKNAIASPLAGLQVYDTTTNKLCCYNGSTWNDLF